MIAFVLLRLAARTQNAKLAPIRFAELVSRCVMQRKSIAQIDRPPKLNPSRSPHQHYNPQLSLNFT